MVRLAFPGLVAYPRRLIKIGLWSVNSGRCLLHDQKEHFSET